MAPGPEASGTRLRLGFAGTPEFAATILEGLLGAGRPPAVVYTQPDRPTGRGRRVRASAVKTLALGHGLPVRQPESLRGTEATAALAEWHLDVLVVAAYGLILPSAILDTPTHGCINVHASLLPRWRGAAPVERAIMAGDQETGVSIMQMERGLDTGPVYLKRRCPVHPDTDGPTLESHLAALGSQALLECLDGLPGRGPMPQPESGVTYAHKITRADAEIDWHRPAAAIARQVRALCGRLPAFTEAGGVRTIILAAGVATQPDAAGTSHSPATPGTIVAASSRGIQVRCGEGALEITSLKLNVGKGRPLRAADAVHNYPDRFTVGKRLGTEPVEP